MLATFQWCAIVYQKGAGTARLPLSLAILRGTFWLLLYSNSIIVVGIAVLIKPDWLPYTGAVNATLDGIHLITFAAVSISTAIIAVYHGRKLYTMIAAGSKGRSKSVTQSANDVAQADRMNKIAKNTFAIAILLTLGALYQLYSAATRIPLCWYYQTAPTSYWVRIC